MNRIIGVLWLKHKDDQNYYSGVLRDLHGDINIAVFPNSYKQADNQPDMNIVLSWGDRKPKPAETVKNSNVKKKKKPETDEKKDDDNDTPF